MDRQTKTKWTLSATAAMFAFAFLWSCVQDTSRTAFVPIDPVTSPSRAIRSTPPSLSAPAPVLTKPPMLGPPEPNLVILPPRISEPEIRVRLTDEEDRPPVIPSGKYRGRIDILRMPTGKYVAINALPLETYLQGVVAKELLPRWSPATFRAQAIAARTFALFELSATGRSKPWDVSDDQSSQVYGGIAGENAAARAAVAETRGQVLTATVGGRSGIFCARYSACIGGASQDPFEAWGDPSVPPLAAHLTGNVDANSPRFNWDRDFVATRADVTRCVRNWGSRNNFPYLQSLGDVVSVVIAQRNSVTRRPTELLLTDSAGKTATLRAEEFRLALMNDPIGKAPKPYSSNFEIRAEGTNFILYDGHGFGHGIGLSQWGAQNLATKGYTHTQILAYFYPGAGLQQMW
jgi:stage II sporulation protein D